MKKPWRPLNNVRIFAGIMKFNHYTSYSEVITNHAGKVLASLWGALENYRHGMVLIGGLVPRFICSGNMNTTLLRPVTLDVDLGISVAVDGDMSPIDWKLRALGYREDQKEGGRFIADIDGIRIPIDFLTEHVHPTSSIEIAGIRASNLLGVKRAIESSRKIMFEVPDEEWEAIQVPLRVCEAGAFLMLKLRAFLHRRQPKDAYDLYYVMRYYDGKHQDGWNIFQQFAFEKKSGNTATQDALQCLETYFSREEDEGPSKAADFVGTHVSSEMALEIRQTLVTAAEALLRC